MFDPKDTGSLSGVGGIGPINILHSRIETLGSTISVLVAIPLWLAYLTVAGVVWIYSIPLSLAIILFVGQYLTSWLGYQRHELWHNYFPGIPNRRFFDLVSSLLFSDPQIYSLAHVTHHRDLHTTSDAEFFCEDYETDSRRRKRQFIFEFLLGNIAWEASAIFRTAKSKELAWRHHGLSVAMRFLFWGLFCFLANSVYPGLGLPLAYVYILTIWFGALVTRHDQWIEHLGIYSNDAPLAERVRMTRNLPDTHWTNRLWNLFNHNDPRSHYFHHAYPQLNLRDRRDLELPEDVPRITIPEYLKALWNYYKSI